MIEPDAFRAEIEAFITKTKIAPTRFGKEAVGDPRFVFDLREGRAPGWRTAQRVREFMAGFGAPAPEQGSAA